MSVLPMLIVAVVAFTCGVLVAKHAATCYRNRWKAALAIIAQFQPELDQEERAKRLAILRGGLRKPKAKYSSTELRALLKQIKAERAAR